MASVLALGSAAGVFGACSAGEEPDGTGASSGTSNGGNGGGIADCPRCDFNVYVGCDGTTIDCDAQGLICAPSLGGCAECNPGQKTCVGNEVHECGADGKPNGPIVETCDVGAGMTCSLGACKTACQVAEDTPTNVGCEFWAVDLDQQDGLNDPASVPWGLAISNVGDTDANVTIELNDGAPGAAQQISVIPNGNFTVPKNTLYALNMPTRELDCGTVPNDYNSPGTCLSSRAFRVTSSSPVVIYQFNVFENAYSNDASLLIPTHSLGQQYRVLGWGAGHPIKIPQFPMFGVDRSYITIVGTEPGTTVTVHPSWKIKGNPPIAATPANGEIIVTLGPFDVLNLETDDGSTSDDPKTIADLSGSFVFSDKPIAVFSGTESTGAPGAFDNVPSYPGHSSDDSCCLDHLEDQMFPLESLGSKYVIARSPVRSTSGWREPDVIRFVGGAEPSTITTDLPEPGFQSFTIQPGEVKTTYAQDNFTAVGDKPFIVGQLLVSQGYVDGTYIGDPALTTFPPVDQYRTEYLLLTPGSWDQNWVVITAEVGSNITIDGAAPVGCTVEPAGTIEGKTYESRRCPMPTDFGAHAMSSDKAFGITAYGYGSAGSYAVAGGADLKKIYTPPVPK
ncbi:MAG TPA: IgGFc-binding protein [Polyangiaceae bacterium]|nr:IgGFc-binding protein [Polyangiaceae bacterium]